jgi:hypothetical protein
MIKKFIFVFSLLILFFFAGSEDIKAERYPACDMSSGVISDDDVLGAPEQWGVCQSPASYYEFFFKNFLVCTGFPELGTFSNCQDLEISPTSVKITNNSVSSIDGVLPLPGQYTYSVSLVSPEIKVAGTVQFESPQLAGAQPGTDNWSTGKYCQQKPGNFIFSQVQAENYDWNMGNTYCRDTPFTEEEITPSTLTLDDFLLVGSEYKATNNDTFDPSYDFNAVALDANNQIATRGEDVESLFLVQKLKQPVTVSPDDTTIEFTFSLERGLAHQRNCTLNNNGDPENNPSCLLTWFWMGGSNMRLRTY